MRYSKRKTLTLATGLACLSAALLVASEPPPQPQGKQSYQHIEQQDIYLVMSEDEQLKHATNAVQRQLIAPLTPVRHKAPVFSRAMIPADAEPIAPTYSPVFAKAQNGTVPFTIYRIPPENQKLKPGNQTHLFLIGYYDVTTGRVMVFNSLARDFVAANEPSLDLKKIGFHQDPQQKPFGQPAAKALVKHEAKKLKVAKE